MFYCQKGKDSDVEVFPLLGMTCVACYTCSLKGNHYVSDDSKQMLIHLNHHIETGHKVPLSAIGLLIKEAERGR
jgi:hypothetical protein